jgi:hypothetical protein
MNEVKGKRPFDLNLIAFAKEQGGVTGSALLGRYGERQANRAHKGEVPQLQGYSPGKTQREGMPRVWNDPPHAAKEGHETESLTAHHFLCHRESIERWRMDER